MGIPKDSLNDGYALEMHYDMYWSLEQILLAQWAENARHDLAESLDSKTICIEGSLSFSPVDLKVHQRQDVVGAWTIDD